MAFKMVTKGQLISKCLFGVIVLTKIPTKLFYKKRPNKKKKVANQIDAKVYTWRFYVEISTDFCHMYFVKSRPNFEFHTIFC